MLPGGAYLLYVSDDVVPDDKVLARLSLNASLVACDVNETVRSGFAVSWASGVEQWSVLHDAEKGLQHLQTAGPVPAQGEAIRDRLQTERIASQGLDGRFEVPIELFVALGGVRYDEDIAEAEGRSLAGARTGEAEDRLGAWRIECPLPLPPSPCRRGVDDGALRLGRRLITGRGDVPQAVTRPDASPFSPQGLS